MSKRREQFERLAKARFPKHRKTVVVLGGLSVLVLVGLTLTGIWQFLFHASDPDWYNYRPDSDYSQRAKPSVGMARWHGIFGDASMILALAGGGWFAYQIAEGLPKANVIAFLCTLTGVLTAIVFRFNVVKLTGLEFEDAGTGYLQIFTNDVDYVVTGKIQWGPNAFRALTVAHVLTVPILLWFGWQSIRRTLDAATPEAFLKRTRSQGGASATRTD